MNAWLDERNVERTVRLNGNHQNSALALLAPDSPAVDPGDFPDRSDCLAPPMPFFGDEQESLWQGTIRRSFQFAEHMRRVAALHPGHDAPTSAQPTLPVLPDLVQGLNIAACDSRALIAVVGAESAADARLAELAFDSAIAGRVHWVRASRAQWDAARASERVVGAATELPGAALVVLSPEPYGRFGTAVAATPIDVEDLRAKLLEGLAEFRHAFRKQDRSTHILEGLREGITWEDADASDWRRFLPEEPQVQR